MVRIWLVLALFITSCANNFKDNTISSSECNCMPTKVRNPNSQWNDSIIYLKQVFQNDTTKFIFCNNMVTDSTELADHTLIWNSRPIRQFGSLGEYYLTKTVLNSDSIRQIDYFWVTKDKKFRGTGMRLMLNKNSKKIYVNNSFLISNRYMTLAEWCKWDDLPDLPD